MLFRFGPITGNPNQQDTKSITKYSNIHTKIHKNLPLFDNLNKYFNFYTPNT